jgi:hypothetical protein
MAKWDVPFIPNFSMKGLLMKTLTLCFGLVSLTMLTSWRALACPMVDAIVTPYLQVTESLASDDLAKAKAAVPAVQAALKGMGKHGSCPFPAKDMESSMTAIAAAKDLKAAREGLKLSSDAVKALYLEGVDKGLDIAYCPMVKSYWLQKRGAIRNPYYGKDMLDCGFVANAKVEKERAKK